VSADYSDFKKKKKKKKGETDQCRLIQAISTKLADAIANQKRLVHYLVSDARNGSISGKRRARGCPWT
jgi:hypothetical protein